MYTHCRGQGLVVYQRTKNGKEVQVFGRYPTGYSSLPEPGGLLDQPYRLMEFFDSFMSGEMSAVGT